MTRHSCERMQGLSLKTKEEWPKCHSELPRAFDFILEPCVSVQVTDCFNIRLSFCSSASGSMLFSWTPQKDRIFSLSNQFSFIPLLWQNTLTKKKKMEEEKLSLSYTCELHVSLKEVYERTHGRTPRVVNHGRMLLAFSHTDFLTLSYLSSVTLKPFGFAIPFCICVPFVGW